MVSRCCFYTNFTSACLTKMKNYLCIHVCFASPKKDEHVHEGQIKFEYIYRYMYYEIYRYYYIMKFINILMYHSYMMTEQVPVWLLKLLKSTDWYDSMNNCFLFVLILTIFYLCTLCLRSLEVVIITITPFKMIFPKKKPKLWLQCTQFSAVFASNIWQI